MAELVTEFTGGDQMCILFITVCHTLVCVPILFFLT